MDPPLITESAFSATSLSAYSLSEIWPLGGEASHSGLPDVRVGSVGRLGSRDGSADASTVMEHLGGRKRKGPTAGTEQRNGESSQMCSAAHGNISKTLSNKSAKSGRLRNEIHTFKSNEGTSSIAAQCKQADLSSRTSEPLKGYIHVRARRGQATDSHSLAERARREKISERMKILQEIVPGCNKVIGKALVLDEIINYIQSLRRQVEFLSTKLEAVNSQLNMNPKNGFPTKDPFDATGMMFAPQTAREYVSAPEPEWLHMQIGTNFEQPKLN